MTKHDDQNSINNFQKEKLTTNQKIAKLRYLMKKNNLDAYYINTADPHQSEYIAEHYQSRSWFTGFTGSAGYAIVTHEEAFLWVDGRYFIQAAKEIENSEFKMMKIATSGYPTLEEWFLENLDSGDTLGLNGQLISQKFYQDLSEKLLEKNIKIRADFSLIEDIWQDRPTKPTDPIYIHELKYTGRTALDKISEVREKMTKDHAEAALYAGLNDIAWLFNIRGNDVKHTPVVMAFALITKDDAYLYIDQNKIDGRV
ncbi:MAG: aminopeptidase P family protein, partial [Bacteroidales bacterium]|nr:aminopeptidase P family protein [Bacteroidales bacterium]